MQLLYAKIKELVCAQATNTNKSGKDYFSTVVPAPCSDLVSLLHSFFCTNVCCFSHVLSVAFCLPVTFTPKWPSFMSKKLIGVKHNRPPFLILIGVKPNRPPFLMDLSFFCLFFSFFFFVLFILFFRTLQCVIKSSFHRDGDGSGEGGGGGGVEFGDKKYCMCHSFVTCTRKTEFLVTPKTFWWRQNEAREKWAQEAKLSVSDDVPKSRLVKLIQIHLHVQSFFFFTANYANLLQSTRDD